jgi:hypothetical protein
MLLFKCQEKIAQKESNAMNDIYTITSDWYTPKGQWTDANPMEFKHAANTAVKMIRESDDREFPIFWHELTVWGGSLEVTTVRGGKVTWDADLEPAEGKYIAVAIDRALTERSARFERETGASVERAWLTRDR